MSDYLLPAGMNADDVNGDEVNGPGTFWPVWPAMFDSMEASVVLVITPQMLSVFDGCPDLVVPCDTWEITLSPEIREIEVKQA